MRWIVKKIVGGIILLIIICIGGAAFYISHIDWGNQHKDKIIDQFYKSTGKVMRFDGALNFRFFPVPHLRANNVKIFNNQASTDKALAEIRNLDVELELKPLLSGEFNVTKMELIGVTFNIDWDNGFNWQDDLSPDQRQLMEESRLSLNSALLKEAEVTFESAENNISFHLSNLNGEIFAESLLGPFRMEGNYLNGSSPEGFAMTIGRLSEASATPVSIAITHPSSNSYVRFDGSFQNTNKVINGNVIIESENISKFTSANFTSFKIPEEYNKKAALGFDIALNPQNISLSNIVVKYGETTSGSGNLQIPTNKEDGVIKTSFNFADINLNDFSSLIDTYLEKFKNFEDMPKTQVEGEIKALRVHYNGQQLRNFDLPFEYSDKVLILRDAEMLLPGNTNTSISAEIFPLNDVLHYKGSTTIRTDNLMQTLKWLKIEPQQIAPSVYKNLVLNTKFSGNLDRIQLSPFKLTLDKSTATGEIGFILGDKKDIMVITQIDTINFDNYISSIPDEIKNKKWLERVLYRFGKMSMLNDIDLVLDAKADLVIYENMPFEKVAIKGNILNKKAEIENISVDKVANTKINLKGNLSGFGSFPQLTNFNYDIKSSDITSLINKLELKVPDLNYKRFNNLTASGTINGSTDEININTSVLLGSLQTDYIGKINRSDNSTDFEGKLTLKHPSFNQLLTNIQSPYQPEGENLGMLQLNADIKGNQDNLDIKNMDLVIGQTNISGNASFEKNNNQTVYSAQIQSNRLDIGKLLQKTKSSPQLGSSALNDQPNFIARPYAGNELIDYTPYKNINVKAKIETGELIWQDLLIKDAKFQLEDLNNTLSVKDFSGIYKDTPFKSEIVLNIENSPTIIWTGNVQNANLNNFDFSGKIYGLQDGTFSGSWNLSSSAESFSNFWSKMKGSAELKALSPLVKGINANDIYNDLLKRETNDGLSEEVRNSLKSGSTQFQEVSSHLNITDGKFSLSDSQMIGENLKIKLYGEGNFADWTMNTVFNAKFDEPQYLPEFSFILKNDIANPVVDVNVSSLLKFYQSKIDQREAEVEKAIEDENNRRLNAWNEQKRISDNLIADARNVIEKEIDEKIQSAYNEKSTVQFNVLKQELGGILASLIEKMSLFDINNLKDDDIVKADEINKEAQQQLKKIPNKINEIQIEDVKSYAEECANKITEEYNLLKQVSFYYNGLLEKYNERMAGIKTEYNLESDPVFQRKKEDINTQISLLEKLNDDASNIIASPSASVEDYQKSITELTDIANKLKEGREKVKSDIEDIDKQQTIKIDSAIELYHNQIEKEKDNLLLKENTGSISIKKTGQTIKVSRDLEEIKNADQEISKEKVRVLDFTKEKIEIESSDKPKVGVVKKGSNRIAN